MVLCVSLKYYGMFIDRSPYTLTELAFDLCDLSLDFA